MSGYQRFNPASHEDDDAWLHESYGGSSTAVSTPAPAASAPAAATSSAMVTPSQPQKLTSLFQPRPGGPKLPVHQTPQTTVQTPAATIANMQTPQQPSTSSSSASVSTSSTSTSSSTTTTTAAAATASMTMNKMSGFAQTKLAAANTAASQSISGVASANPKLAGVATAAKSTVKNTTSQASALVDATVHDADHAINQATILANYTTAEPFPPTVAPLPSIAQAAAVSPALLQATVSSSTAVTATATAAPSASHALTDTTAAPVSGGRPRAPSDSRRASMFARANMSKAYLSVPSSTEAHQQQTEEDHPPHSAQVHFDSTIPPEGPTGGSLKKSNSLPSSMNKLKDDMKEGSDLTVRAADAMEKFMDRLRGLNADNRPKLEDEQLGTLNYDTIEDHILEMSLENDGSKGKRHKIILLGAKFLMTVLIALGVAAAMYFVSNLADFCAGTRVENTLDLIREGNHAGAFFLYIGGAIILSMIAAILVSAFAPGAKGGGVPYILAYLNGTNVASYFSSRIVLIKIITLGLTISSGITLGMEGPLLFIGAGIALMLVRLVEKFSWGQRGRYTRVLSSIKEERVFMAGGQAAGLAVAFNAPIAGILMALEGSTAFLTVPVVLRIFGCAMFASFFNNLGHSKFSSNIRSNNLIVITPGQLKDYVWVLWEIFFFFFIAVICGLLGAVAIWINVKVTKWRHKNIEPHPAPAASGSGANHSHGHGSSHSHSAPSHKEDKEEHYRESTNLKLAVGEVVFIASVTAIIWFTLPYLFGCRIQHEQCFPTISIETRCRRTQCPDNYYSELGSILYSSSDQIARILFDRSLDAANEISPIPLLLYGFIYLFLVSIVYGAHVPGGLFVPSVITGGVFGRAVGTYCNLWFSSAINPGVYALLGAASMLGGFTRLALPVTVMLVEMTGDATYLLPIMFCVVVAKVVSDEIVPPLYPQHMQIEGIPTLGDKLNPGVANLKAKDIMNRKFYSVCQVEQLSHLLDVLDKSKSMLLPVTTSDGKFIGMIMRRSVLYALKYTPLYHSMNDVVEQMQQRKLSHSGPQASHKDDTSSPHHGSLSALSQQHASSSTSSTTDLNTTQISRELILEAEKRKDTGHGWKDTVDYADSNLADRFDESHKGCYVNLTPFMDAGALTAHEETSVKRIATIFRRLGISHMGVSDIQNRLVGLITRRLLLKPPSKDNDDSDDEFDDDEDRVFHHSASHSHSTHSSSRSNSMGTSRGNSRNASPALSGKKGHLPRSRLLSIAQPPPSGPAIAGAAGNVVPKKYKHMKVANNHPSEDHPQQTFQPSQILSNPPPANNYPGGYKNPYANNPPNGASFQPQPSYYDNVNESKQNNSGYTRYGGGNPSYPPNVAYGGGQPSYPPTVAQPPPQHTHDDPFGEFSDPHAGTSMHSYSYGGR